MTRITPTRLLVALLFAAATLGVPSAAAAQEGRGTIAGTVVDGSEAVLPGATVVISNIAMGTDATTVTNESGLFNVPYLIPGMYRITVSLTGFKRLVREGIELRVGDRLSLDLEVAVGGTVEEITVSAAAPLLETSDASLGQVIDARSVAELPTPHGDPFALIGLSAGVSFRGDARLDRPFEPTHIVGYSMGGTRSNRSDVTIDGVPSTATANAGQVIASFVPPQDLVQEFKVQTATFDAGSGNTEGGVTNLVLKSGANRFSGTISGVKMPPGLFANDFFAKQNNVPLPDFSYTRMGGTLGGRVILPGYDGRNKTFFMYGVEGIHEARPRNNGTPTVPSEKMRNGDFSELLALGPQYQIYNPFTRRAAGNGRFEQDPFPGNIIPQNMISPIAREIMSYMSLPKTPGNADGTSNFQNPSLKENTKYLTNTVRIDHVLSDKQRIYGRVSWYDRNSNYNNYFGNLATGEQFKFTSRQVAFDDVYMLTPSTVLNVKYGYDRFLRGTDSNPANHGFELASLGFPTQYAGLISDDIRRFPRVDITGYQGTGIGGESRPIETQSVSAIVTRSAGAHSLRSGLEFRRYRETSDFFANNQTGQFNFDSTWTRGPFDNSAAAPGSLGQSFASFLLGVPSGGLIAGPSSYDERSSAWGFFVQDDWKVGANLTVNMGVRYEFETPLFETNDRSVRGFDFDAEQPMAAAARAAYALNPTPEVPASAFNVSGGLQFAGVNGQPSGLYTTPKSNIMPRVGFAYQLGESTVVRGGYGMFYGFLGQRRGDVVQSGFSQNTNLVVSLDNGLTFLETLNNPFQSGIEAPVGASLGIETFLGQSVTFFDDNPKSPRMQRWQVGVQRTFGSWLSEATYVGNYGSQIETNRNINVTPLEYLSTSPTRDSARNSYLTAQVANPFFGLMPTTAGTAFRGATIARERLLRPFPQFDAVNTTTNEGQSWYSALQLRLERRFSAGYTLSTNYTYSRYEQATEFLNGADASPVRIISDQDVPHRFTLSGIYELPFGDERRFTSGNNVVSAIISGWQISGIYALQSGVPVGFGNIIFTGDPADLGLSGDAQSIDQWFNIDAGFNRVSALQLVSNVRTAPLRYEEVRTDTINNVDLSIIKNTAIGTKTLQIRFETLNAFDRAQFAGPNTDPTSQAFGTIRTSTGELSSPHAGHAQVHLLIRPPPSFPFPVDTPSPLGQTRGASSSSARLSNFPTRRCL